MIGYQDIGRSFCQDLAGGIDLLENISQEVRGQHITPTLLQEVIPIFAEQHPGIRNDEIVKVLQATKYVVDMPVTWNGDVDVTTGMVASAVRDLKGVVHYGDDMKLYPGPKTTTGENTPS